MIPENAYPDIGPARAAIVRWRAWSRLVDHVERYRWNSTELPKISGQSWHEILFGMPQGNILACNLFKFVY